jgi:hypothetical protein
MQFTKILGLAAVGATRCRSVIPAPPRRFRKMPGWRQRKCIGGTVIIIIIGGTAGTITATTTIIMAIATGTAGERDCLAQRSSRPVSLRACFDLKGCLETGEIAARYLRSSGSTMRKPS